MHMPGQAKALIIRITHTQSSLAAFQIPGNPHTVRGDFKLRKPGAERNGPTWGACKI